MIASPIAATISNVIIKAAATGICSISQPGGRSFLRMSAMLTTLPQVLPHRDQ
jgi:hypothetical protein